jgi:pimeloyl-ACP methyl ester carboxylesterase
MQKSKKIVIAVIGLSLILGFFFAIDAQRNAAVKNTGSSVASESLPGDDVEGDFFASDGARIHYWFYNRGTETATIFLHGGPGRGTADFRLLQAKAYADAFGSLLVFDQRGNSESDTNPDLKDTITFSRFVQDINELRDYVIPDKQVIILSRSFGGLLAAHYADSHPKQVKAYIFVAPGPLDFPKLEEERTALVASVGTTKISTVTHEERAKITKMAVGLSSTALDTELAVEANDPEDTTVLDGGAALTANEPSFFENNYPLLTSVQNTPTLVVYGEYDSVVPPLAIEGMKPYLSNATYTMLPGTHEAAYALQDEFFSVIRTFFTGIENK